MQGMGGPKLGSGEGAGMGTLQPGTEGSPGLLDTSVLAPGQPCHLLWQKRWNLSVHL